MGQTAKLAGNRRRSGPPRAVLALMIQNHPHRTGMDLRAKFVRRLVHRSASLLESWSLRKSRGGSERCRTGAFTLHGLVAELAARGPQVGYRAVWEFVHAERLTFKKR